MKSPRGRAVMAGVLGALLLLTGAALAQPAPSAPSAPALGEQDVKARKDEALRHFEKGSALFLEERWDAALAEFMHARALYPTRSTMMNAAACLRNLRRVEEALDMFEEVLRFPNLPANDREVVEREIKGLEERVGTLVVEGAAPGASLVIDGRYRGTLPLSGPLRIGVGSHEVRAYKEGLDPFGATAEVTAKQRTVVQLQALSTRGALTVTEQHGRVLDVVIDGAVVGKTPWEGPVAVGEHLVHLRGNVNLEAVPKCTSNKEGAPPGKQTALRRSIELGSQPVSVPVWPRKVRNLTLTAEELATSIRIEPTPASASVAIDCVVVGRGTWNGRLLVGSHVIEVAANGFFPETRTVSLDHQKPQRVTIELKRDWSTVKATAVGTAYGVGALGLGVFAVTGGMALGQINAVKARCGGTECPRAEQTNVDRAATLGTAATVGLVVGSIGVAAGTIVLLGARSSGRKPGPGAASTRSRPAGGWVWSAGVGLGRLDIKGSF